jgi:molecular chaperone GrpE
MEKDKKINQQTVDKNKELEECRAMCEEYLNGWKRERADFLNYKKEEMEKIGNLIKYANQELIVNILPIVDNIYLAESHIPEKFEKDIWIEGFIQIKSQMIEFLKNKGIEEIKTIGEVFDPNFMEAVEEIATGNVLIDSSRNVLVDSTRTFLEESGIVAEEVQKGYTLHGKLVRPAKVKVNK